MNAFPLLAVTLALLQAPASPVPQPVLLAPPTPGGGCVAVTITQGLTSTQACEGDSVTFEVQATGSDLQYTWTHGGQIVAGQKSSTLTLDDVTQQERGIWCVEVYNACSSQTSCCRLSISNCGHVFCSLTQGAYGNAGGQWNGMNRIQLITLLLGRQALVVGEPGRSLTFLPNASTAECIVDRLPASGPPAALPNFGDQTLDNSSCQTTPPLPEQNDRFRNVLLGQTLSLALNLRLDPDLATLVICGQMTTSNGVFVFDSSVIDGMLQVGGGHAVDSLLALANRALAGGNTHGLSLSTISAAVDSINRAFDECATLQDCQ